MFQRILCVVCVLAMSPIQGMHEGELFEQIRAYDVKGVKKILRDKPELINENARHLDYPPLYYVLNRLQMFPGDHRTEMAQILEEFLQQKNLDVNKSDLGMPPLKNVFGLNSYTDYSMQTQYDLVMDIKKSLKTLFAHTDLDVTITFSPHLGSSTLNILEYYKKLGVDKYHDLLRLFLDLNEKNEKSWDAVLPKMIAMDDVAVVEQIYQTLQKQQWFRLRFDYFWFDAFNFLAQGSLSKNAARAILDAWAGRLGVVYQQLSYDQKNKVAMVIGAYVSAKQHKPQLKQCGHYIVIHVHALAGLPQDVGAVVASFLPKVKDVPVKKQ
jgi:hypothetical protein